MKLLLTSNGFSNPSIIKALEDLVTKPFNELNFAFVPTAATPEDGDKTWLADDIYRAKNLGFKLFDIVNIDALPADQVIQRLEVADVLMFGGGDCFYLLSWIRKNSLDKLMAEWLKTKIYVGISAGSMITNPNLILKSLREVYYENPLGDQDMTALNLVNFLVRPHYQSKYFANVNDENLAKWAKETSLPIYALDDMSALKVDDGLLEVISEGTWKKFN